MRFGHVPVPSIDTISLFQGGAPFPSLERGHSLRAVADGFPGPLIRANAFTCLKPRFIQAD
jgi:hypothetical protein